MSRPVGTRNPDYEARRRALALAASAALIDADGQPTSLNQLARAAGVTVPTLRHYFGDHDGVVSAALAEAEVQGKPYTEALADPGPLGLEDSLQAFAINLELGWSLGLGHLFASALTHGLAHAVRGPAVVDHLLEPTLQALEARLGVHRDRGELVASVDLRAAALALLSPLLLAQLHQVGLDGRRCRPLDLVAFREAHLAAWIRGWGA